MTSDNLTEGFNIKCPKDRFVLSIANKRKNTHTVHVSFVYFARKLLASNIQTPDLTPDCNILSSCSVFIWNDHQTLSVPPRGLGEFMWGKVRISLSWKWNHRSSNQTWWEQWMGTDLMPLCGPFPHAMLQWLSACLPVCPSGCPSLCLCFCVIHFRETLSCSKEMWHFAGRCLTCLEREWEYLSSGFVVITGVCHSDNLDGCNAIWNKFGRLIVVRIGTFAIDFFFSFTDGGAVVTFRFK